MFIYLIDWPNDPANHHDIVSFQDGTHAITVFDATARFVGGTVHPEGDNSVGGSWSGSHRNSRFQGLCCSPTFTCFCVICPYPFIGGSPDFPDGPFLTRTRW